MKKFSGAPISRYQVFTLADGNFVVQWESSSVQELLSGRYRPYEHMKDFGHPVTDYELKQLKASGRVEHFNRNSVWLYALPEAGRFGNIKTLDRGDRVRVYYLSSRLSKSELPQVQSRLAELGLANDFLARSRNKMVVVLGKNGMPFRHLQDAEKAQRLLEASAADIFHDLAIAFVETKVDATHQISGRTDPGSDDLNLKEIIASQGDSTVTENKCLILAVNQADERETFTDLFIEKMRLDVQQADSGLKAVQLVEDFTPDVLVSDSSLPDMHVWQLLSKLKEIGRLDDLPVIVITDEPTFGATVAKVDSLIVRPVALARLRHSIWTVLNNTVDNSKPDSV
jgi:CheY-like chemotaxis protein